jgi:uncharacterized membrane protein YphA (DoxX/SURF4 family)
MISILLRLILAGVFGYAAVPKILDPAGFAKSIHNYQMLPDAMINPLAIYLPWLELLAAVALVVIPSLRRGARLLIALMLVVFIVAIGSAMARGINIDCGCFSTTGGGMKAGVPHLLLDAALLVIALLPGRPGEADRSPRAA